MEMNTVVVCCGAKKNKRVRSVLDVVYKPYSAIESARDVEKSFIDHRFDSNLS